MLSNQAYTETTNGQSAKPIRIHAKHGEYLHARGVDESFAIQNKLVSVKEDAFKSAIGKHPAGLFIPYYFGGTEAEGAVIRCFGDQSEEKNEKKLDRFWRASGSPVRVYFPPTVPASAWSDPTVAKVIVEGPIKTLHLAQRGYAAIGLGGVSTGHDTEALKRGLLQLHPDFRRVVLTETPITVYSMRTWTVRRSLHVRCAGPSKT